VVVLSPVSLDYMFSFVGAVEERRERRQHPLGGG